MGGEEVGLSIKDGVEAAVAGKPGEQTLHHPFHEIAIGLCAQEPAVGRLGRCPAGLRPARSQSRR
jgi:hypothetical protein